jgi:hypothetical protein
MACRQVCLTGCVVMASLMLVEGGSLADDRWVEVAPSVPGTPPTLELRPRQGGLTIEVDLTGFFARKRTVDGQELMLLEVPGFGGTGEIGEPDLPFRTVLVPIANGPSADLRVTHSVKRTVLTSVTVMPEQAPMPECGAAEPGFVIDREAYSSDAWFPAHSARIAQDAVVRGQRFLVVDVDPLAFNPARREVVASTHLTVEIDLEGFLQTRHDLDPDLTYVLLVGTARWSRRRNSGISYRISTPPASTGPTTSPMS